MLPKSNLSEVQAASTGRALRVLCICRGPTTFGGDEDVFEELCGGFIGPAFAAGEFVLGGDEFALARGLERGGAFAFDVRLRRTSSTYSTRVFPAAPSWFSVMLVFSMSTLRRHIDVHQYEYLLPVFDPLPYSSVLFPTPPSSAVLHLR